MWWLTEYVVAHRRCCGSLGDVGAHRRCGGSLVALHTTEAVVTGSNPASLTVEKL